MHNPFLEVEYFEEELAAYCGSKYAVAVDSCTSGLFLTIKFFNFVGETFIFPRKTYLSMPMMAIASNNKVILKDFDWEGSYRISIKNHENIHLYDSAKRFFKNEYINDSISIKSFHMKKHITSSSGKGGAVLTNNKELYDWLIKARWEGRNPYSDYKQKKEDISIIGYNMNMTPEEAVFLRRQLSSCDDFNKDLEEPNGYRNLDEFEIFSNCEVQNSDGFVIKNFKQKVNNDIFLLRQSYVHGNKFKPLSDYSKMSDKMDFLCMVDPSHGIFSQRIQAHLLGQGCPKCSGYETNTSLEDLKIIAKVHSGELLSKTFKTKTAKYWWKCKNGHTWNAPGIQILNGGWCRKCSYSIISKKITRKNGDEFLIHLAKKNKGECLNPKYTLVTDKYSWKCEKGHIWESRASDVTQGRWCPYCKLSIGEKKIENVLSSLKINFSRQKMFDGCRYKRLLKYDFFLPDYNMVIEYDGSQHFKQATGYWKRADLSETIKKDEIKEKFCEQNGIKIIRIPYLMKDQIEDIILLEHQLNFSRNLNFSKSLRKIDKNSDLYKEPNI